MSHDSGSQAPRAWRELVVIAAWLAPSRERTAWRAHRSADLESLYTLIERGELVLHGRAHLFHFFLSAFAGAFWLRFSRDELRRFVRGPTFVLATGMAALALIAVLSHGFARTRFLIQLWQSYHPPVPQRSRYDPTGDILFGNIAPIVVAFVTGVMIMIIGRASLVRRGWRHWSFLVAKFVLMLTVGSLLWLEFGYALRKAIPAEHIGAVLGGVVLGLVFIGSFGWGVLWSLADQRRRCPVCLSRLEMPVTLGSWASVFDPPTTELLCPDGHGSLSVLEAEAEAADRWIALDSSWRSLFRRKSRDKETILH
jgi:hypothetical protein